MMPFEDKAYIIYVNVDYNDDLPLRELMPPNSLLMKFSSL